MAFYIIESKQQLQEFYKKEFKEVFIEIIPLNDNIHPNLNEISLIYIKPLNDPKAYLLCLNHNDALKLKPNHVEQVLKQFDKIWVQDKKSFLYYYPLKTILDCSIILNKIIKPQSKTHTYFNNRYSTKDNVNSIIPLVKHYERCEQIYSEISHVFTEELPPHFEFYNTKVLLAYLKIEANGIKINNKKLHESFEPIQDFYSIKDNKIYTHYNLYTTTHRPSNAFNNVNFSALNKENGCRKSFIPENDKFIEIDISAAHPTIAAKLIGFKFGKEDIHQSFADMYGVSYDEAKKITFRQMNGKIYEEYKHLEYFNKLQTYKDILWHKFITDGWIESPISKFRFYKRDFKDMNPNKLLNYIIQTVETEENVLILMEIHKILKHKNTKIVLTTYDSFLIDFDIDEDGLIEEISQIFIKNKFKIKTKQFKSNYAS